MTIRDSMKATETATLVQRSNCRPQSKHNIVFRRRVGRQVDGRIDDHDRGSPLGRVEVDITDESVLVAAVADQFTPVSSIDEENEPYVCRKPGIAVRVETGLEPWDPHFFH